MAEEMLLQFPLLLLLLLLLLLVLLLLLLAMMTVSSKVSVPLTLSQVFRTDPDPSATFSASECSKSLV